MADGIRDRLENVKRAVREKAMRMVADAVTPYHRRQTEQFEHLEREVVQLREQVAKQGEQAARQSDHALDRVVEFEIRSRRDIVFAADQEAALQSAHFTHEHMQGAKEFGDPHQTLEHGLSLAPTGGMALEFGVYTGTTLKIISAARGDNEVFGFDSFKGLPDDWRNGFPAGTFDVTGLPDVSGAELVVGWFDDTLPGFLEAHQGPVDFLHVDGDLYSSAKIVLDLVGPRLRVGSVIVFDEFFNFPTWQKHEYRAWLEFVERTGVEYTYEAYTYDDEQVVVRVTAVPDQASAH